MKVNWTDLLDELKQRNGDQEYVTSDSSKPSHSNAVMLEGNPTVEIYRQIKRINSFSTPHGNGSYDPYGGLLLTRSDPYPSAVYANSKFFTRVGCDVILSKKYSLSMKPNKFRNLLKKTDKIVCWSIKTDFSEAFVSKVHEVLKTENQVCMEHISIQLQLIHQLTSDTYSYNLSITTDIIPDDLNKFCFLNDFYPLRQEGKNLSDFEAALLLVESMVRCCRAVYFAMLENDK